MPFLWTFPMKALVGDMKDGTPPPVFARHLLPFPLTALVDAEEEKFFRAAAFLSLSERGDILRRPSTIADLRAPGAWRMF